MSAGGGVFDSYGRGSIHGPLRAHRVAGGCSGEEPVAGSGRKRGHGVPDGTVILICAVFWPLRDTRS